MISHACFNELSAEPLCSSPEEAKQRLTSFAKLMEKIKKLTGMTKIRHATDLSGIRLTDDMTVQDFINANIRSSLAIAMLSMFVKPQVDDGDLDLLENYYDTSTEVTVREGKKKPADGFNAAYCQSTFCVGFDSDALWHKDFFDITVASGGKERTLRWACISSPDFFSEEPEHKGRKDIFISWLKGIRPVKLVKSLKSPEEKAIELRDDHGKDKLTAHAKSLRNSPYVDSILTSLSFKSHARGYIHKIYDDGLIDIVLYWEDKGYCMRVKTTGRNAAETKAIAVILKEKYG